MRNLDGRAAPVLPVVLAPSDQLWVTERGDPVWAVDDAELKQLRETLALFGVAVAEVEAAATTAEPHGPGLVVAVGKAAADAARLYAHLTRRSWTQVDRIGDLPGSNDFDVLVTQENCLTPEVLDSIYAPGRETAPGLVQAADPQRLRMQVLSRTAAAGHPGDRPCRQVDYVPSRAGGLAESADRASMGAAASPGELLAWLTAGQTVLTVVTHSDGIDAELGQHWVLCPMDEAWATSSSASPPTCWHTKHCYRLRRPVEGLHRSGRLLHPSAIASRAFILNACSVVMPTDGATDPVFGIASRLVESTRLGALFTSWRSVVGRQDSADQLAAHLMAGESAGTALALHNSQQASLASGHRLCLFGDPAMRAVEPSGSTGVLAVTPKRPVWTRPASPAGAAPQAAPSVGDQVTLLKYCLSSDDNPPPGSNPSLADMPDALRLALAAIEQYEATRAWRPRLRRTDVTARTEPQMQRAVADLVARRGRIFDLWVRYARAVRLSGFSPCDESCPHTAVRYIVDLAISDIESRVLEICPRCGFTLDAPAGWDLRVRAGSDGRVQLVGGSDETQWAGALTLQYRWPLPTRTWAWPRAADGGPAPSFQIPDALHPVPAIATATMVYGTRVLVASRAVRGAPTLR